MKKRVLMAVLLAGVIAAAGCGDKKADKDQEASTKTEQVDAEAVKDTEDSKDTEEKEQVRTTAQIMEDVDIEKAVTLGTYKGITVEKVISPVLDEEVEKQIQISLQDYPVEVTGRAAENGDVVNIDYVGKIDGEEFEGGSEQGHDLTLGSGQFIEGFEEGLVGAGIGDSVVLNLKFPDQYNADLAGKDVEFTVKVNAIKKPLEEPTDEWVAANIEGMSTVAEYRDSIVEQIEENNKLSAENQVRYTAWQQVVEGSTINEYPEELVEMGKQMYIQQTEVYAQYAQMELEDMVEASGITMEEFEKNAEEYGKDIAAQALVNQAICKAENYKIGDEAYNEALQTMIKDYQMEDEEQLYQMYGRDNVEQTIMLERVTNLILSQAQINEVEPDASEMQAEDEKQGEDAAEAENGETEETEAE